MAFVRWGKWLGGRARLALSLGSLLGGVLCTSLGCSLPPAKSAEDKAAQAVEEEESRDPNALPRAFEQLQLSDAQRSEILALRDGLRREFAEVELVGRSFLRASAPAIRRCKGDNAFISMAAARLIATGEGFRSPALNSIDKLHGILTQRQRQQLVKSLLGEDEEKKEEEAKDKRKKRNDSAIKSLGERMDLSVGQLLKLLVRLAAVQGDYEDQMEPWRDSYKEGLRAFIRPDFEARKQPAARAPVVKVAVHSVRKGMRVGVPVLEPAQCRELATIMIEWADAPPRRQAAPPRRQAASPRRQAANSAAADTPAAGELPEASEPPKPARKR